MVLAVSVRRLRPTDLPAYKALRDSVMADHPTSFTSDAAPERSAESYRLRLGEDRPEGGMFTLGAWRGRELVGAVSCERDLRAKVRHIGHLIGMMVRSDLQGLGVGRQLLGACIEQARSAEGLAMLTLSVTASNTAAVRLYERAGFARYAHLPSAILVDGVFHAKDQMVLSLAP